jgi:hypothetical protein
MLGLTKDHLTFFHKHKFIELEELMTEDEIDTILSELNGQTYDLWRTNDTLKKIILKRSLAGVASELSKIEPIRIGYDRLIEGRGANSPLNLIEMSAIRRVVSGVAIQLQSYDGEELYIPKKKGSGTFFTPYYPLTFPEKCQLLLIVYTESKALYVYEPRDLNCHALKKLGYGFNDRLRSETHPILYQR